jgi:cell division protein FtsB
VSRARVLAGIAIVGGMVFGAAGGEYGTWDWWQLRRDLKSERTAIDSLKVAIDSLQTEVKLLETDPATQERVAREKFGMLRPGELMFQVEIPDEP